MRPDYENRGRDSGISKKEKFVYAARDCRRIKKEIFHINEMIQKIEYGMMGYSGITYDKVPGSTSVDHEVRMNHYFDQLEKKEYLEEEKKNKEKYVRWVEKVILNARSDYRPYLVRIYLEGASLREVSDVLGVTRRDLIYNINSIIDAAVTEELQKEHDDIIAEFKDIRAKRFAKKGDYYD